jgi:hypothetical protein
MGLRNQTILDEIDGILADAFAPEEIPDFRRGVVFAVKSLAGAIRQDSENLADEIMERLHRRETMR